MSGSHPMEEYSGFQGRHPYNLQQAVERFECGYIANILELTRWDFRRTARMLEISPDVLAAKMLYYQLLPGSKKLV